MNTLSCSKLLSIKDRMSLTVKQINMEREEKKILQTKFSVSHVVVINNP